MGTIHLADVTMFWSTASGGVRRYLHAKRAWLQRHTGWRHTIAAPVVDTERMVRMPAVPLPFSHGYRMPWQRTACADRLAGLAPDLIEAGDPYRLAWSTLDATRRLQIPSIAFCHSNLAAMAERVGGRPAAALARAYMKRLYRQFDLVLAPSEAMQAHLVDLGLANVERQALGVDTHVFHPKRSDAVWRASLGLPPNARVLVYAGRFAPEKHLDLLCGAVARLGPPYVLLALGAGPTPPSGPRVIVRRFEHDSLRLARVLASADAFVHAGDQETFGLAVLEALACGLPVVARKAEGLAELVDEQVGIGVDRPHADDFAQAIEACFSRDRQVLARAARARAESYDWSSVMPSLMARYHRLLTRRAAAVPSLSLSSQTEA
ncbi:glycosyltransferase [Aquabacterium sp. A7-Y]|uniref:glycosyltransferase n=1 Tax=Aquabacterium sp. A7-Y TaxID=1349605 RepID=UPI00223CA9F6|nr:glycosyltransferase [Aquabacterium sp. A7-Y]MCW7536322.1 glycosyltransferase [Aquabacterium sp. A7-Y]